MKKIFFVFGWFFLCGNLVAQNDSAVYSKFTTAQNRTVFYKNLVTNSIIKNLSSPLNSSNEYKWQNAFSAIELINYRQPWSNAKIKTAVDSLAFLSIDFQQSLLEMLYACNLKEYSPQINNLLKSTNDAKIFAMSAEYLLLADTTKKNLGYIKTVAEKKSSQYTDPSSLAIMLQLNRHLKELGNKKNYPDKNALESLFANSYLKGNVVVYSIQRKNRDYPGLVIVKDTAGNFIKDSAGKLFSTQQLARSLSNMPAYISNGNTPQGLYRLYGFGKSKSSFIGPTENLQLAMPFETSPRHFLKDSLITDTVWQEGFYEKLLPAALKNYLPLYQSLYAGAAGRTEIIAHGTTVDPHFYTGQKYYPFTPTAGCLCTNETWDETGKRVFSDQQKLSDAVKQAGGADGYLIVIDIDDSEKMVSAEEILPYLQ